MKILVIGSSGQLGTQIFNLKNLLNLYDFYFSNKQELDISSFESVDSFFTDNRFDVVINCAAYTSVDEAEENFDHAKIINGYSIGYICKSLERHKPDTKLIHLSTDYIFDGNFAVPISETDTPNPISKYGKSKLLGEEILQESKIPSIIIRVSWLYSIFGNNFMKTIINLSKTKKSINVIDDQIGSPTSANDLAECILKIINSKRFSYYAQEKGIFNFCNSGSCSWYEFAKEILLLTSSDCKVCPITTDKYNAPAERPKYSVLNITKIKGSFDLEINSWQIALQNTINSANTNYNKSI
tara:strand:- start:162 stop:1055 length:894 start_codon:yes stop_codon:yes gene_type:complete